MGAKVPGKGQASMPQSYAGPSIAIHPKQSRRLYLGAAIHTPTS